MTLRRIRAIYLYAHAVRCFQSDRLTETRPSLKEQAAGKAALAGASYSCPANPGVSFPARRSRPLDFLGICDILEKEAPVANGLPHIRLKSDFLSDLARSVCNTGRAIFYSLSFFRLRRRRRISRRPASCVSFPARGSRPLDFLRKCDIVMKKRAPQQCG